MYILPLMFLFEDDYYVAVPCCYNHRKYKEAYDEVRESFGNIRRNVERYRDAVLHSVSSLCLIMLHILNSLVI